MNRIIFHKTSRQHYKADAVIVWCFDDRFSELTNKLTKENGWRQIDLIKIAGGAKELATDGETAEKRFLADQIAKSIALHHPAVIALMVHADCGAYGKSFDDSKSEADFYAAELVKAEVNLKTFLGEFDISLPIKKYLADFEGIVKI